MILIPAGFCRIRLPTGRLCAKRQKSEIFCLTAKGEIFGRCPQVKSNADAFGEMKSTHRRRGDFTARRAISPPQAISPTPQGWISLPTGLWDSRLIEGDVNGFNAVYHLIFLSFFTDFITASAAIIISSSVFCLPKENRTVESACLSVNPIAERT